MFMAPPRKRKQIEEARVMAELIIPLQPKYFQPATRHLSMLYWPSNPRFDQLFFHLIIEQMHTCWMVFGTLFSLPQGEGQRCCIFQSIVNEVIKTSVENAKKCELRVWCDLHPPGSCAEVKQLPFRSKCSGSTWIISYERGRRLGLRTDLTSRPIVSILTVNENSIWVPVAPSC